MSNNKKLFADAIADAKALREVAVANAKAALEESFMPRIQSMFEKRIMEADELEEEKEEMEERATYEVDKDVLTKSLDEKRKQKKDELDETSDTEKDAFMEGDDDLEEDIDLEELFRSLEEEDDMGDVSALDEMDSELEEGEEEMEENYDLEEILRELEEEENSIYEEEELEEGEDELNENYFEEKAGPDEEISEVTVDELRDMIQDAIKAVMGDQGGDEEGGEMNLDMGAEEEGGEGEEELNVDLGIEDEETEEEPKKEKSKKEKELDELYSLYERKKAALKKEKELDERKKYKGTKDLEEAANKKFSAPFGQGSKHSKIGSPYGAPGKKKAGMNGAYDKKLAMKLNEKAKTEIEEAEEMEEAMKAKKELEEAVRVIKALRGQLNEVNLLNAKLIYVNRIFKANQLTESQKVNVVNSFDKAQTLNEAKNIYEVLKNTVKSSSKVAKAPLRENKSFASSIIGGKSATPVIDTNDTITRMQKLAGIIND